MIFHGFIQAGGGSTRFGTDKALVSLGDKTMLQRTGELLADVCHDVTIIAPAGKYTDAPWPVLADRWPGEGPLGGIVTALNFMKEAPAPEDLFALVHGPCPFALILSCDMPFMTKEFLTFLKKRAVASQALVVVPECGRRLEPLCACWCSQSAGAIQAAFDAGGRKVSEAMKHVPMEVLDESAWKRFDTDGRLFWNMNTLEDYEEARRVIEARAGRGRKGEGQAPPLE